MFGFRKNKDVPPQRSATQAVIVSFDISEDKYNSIQKQISKITDDMEVELENIGAEYDGDEYGDDECNLYFYGPDAEQIFDIVSRDIKKVALRPIRLKLRFGDVEDTEAKEELRRIL